MSGQVMSVYAWLVHDRLGKARLNQVRPGGLVRLCQVMSDYFSLVQFRPD